jgi:DNA-binding CsgD family transcriptional regulator
MDYHSLSRRECDVLRLLARDSSTRRIANALHIRVKIVDTHG